MACFVETHTVTSEDIAPTMQAAVPQGELAVVEGPEEPEEPEVPNLVLAASALPTTQSTFSSHVLLVLFSQLLYPFTFTSR